MYPAGCGVQPRPTPAPPFTPTGTLARPCLLPKVSNKASCRAAEKENKPDHTSSERSPESAKEGSKGCVSQLYLLKKHAPRPLPCPANTIARMAVTAAKRSMMEVDEEEDDPIPNELDNALVHLIPAITACGSDPALPSYLNLDTFEKLAGPALRGGDGAAGANDSSSATTTGRRLDLRISGEIEVAFRHCMHEAGLALVGADADIGGGGGSAAGGGRGGRARKGEKEVTAGTGAASALQSEAEAMVKMMSGPLGILSLALKFVSKEAKLDEGGADINPLLSGLPLLLLEDFLESQVG